MVRKYIKAIRLLPRDEEYRRKMSLSCKGMNRGPKSEETKRKISEGRKGKGLGPLSSELKLKMSLNRKGKGLGPLSQEHKNKISKTLSYIVQHDRNKGILYKEYCLRNNWELKTAQWLDQNNIKWEYETKPFLRPCGKHYLPDFYLPLTNEYIEVKGWLNNCSKEKMDDFVKSGNKLIIIDQSNINNIHLNKIWKV